MTAASASRSAGRHGRHGHDLRRNVSPVLRAGRTRGRLYDPSFGVCTCRWRPWPAAPASGPRRIARRPRGRIGQFESFTRAGRASSKLLASGVDFVCVATPDDRHFAAAKAALAAGKHVLDRKAVGPVAGGAGRAGAAGPRAQACWPRSSITSCSTPITRSCARWWPTASCSTSTTATARCLEPKSISGSQFAEWITGRNPGTYVAVHYIKLIDFTFGGRLKSVQCTRPARHRRPGRRADLGLDAVAADLRVRRRPRGGVRHSHLLGHARQLSRLRRAGGAVSLRQRRVERPQPQAGRRVHGRRPHAARAQDHDQQPLQWHVPRAVGRARRSAATASKCSSGSSARWPRSSSAARRASATQRLAQARALAYNDLSADRQTVAAVQAMEAILATTRGRHAQLRGERQRSSAADWSCYAGRGEPEVCMREA